MEDKYRHLKKVVDCIENRSYYASDFSDSDVEYAKRELAAICHSLSSIPAYIQVDLLKFLDLAESRKPQELIRFKKQHEIMPRYLTVLSEFEKSLEPRVKTSDERVHSSQKGSAKSSEARPNPEYKGSAKSTASKTSNEMARKDIEINELKNRLSKVAGEKLRDNNPSIADLSDINRPTKLAEYFKELYDNEWTSAYDVLHKKWQLRNEEDIVKKLGKMLKMAYEFCLEEARKHREKIRETLVYPVGIHLTLNASVEPNVEEKLRPKIRQIQRETGVYAIPAIQEMFQQDHEREIKMNDWDESPEIMTYIKNCVRICWLFAIQDPPMQLWWPKEQSKIDEHVNEFTKRGTTISYVVWPTLYLHRNGPLMSKGVVQPV
ncbi:uncharacterized protein LOC133173650 [Saccostrea echinata]|uniref:uncharacterized protein LOC133173650 n=1 Tax=Saccostrea echinata TaxID=191078 RepID=UPI002A829C41|nr:uncharacterized protein LOC133173650 [Saccostrea echinata]